jgi:hypothetical protein
VSRRTAERASPRLGERGSRLALALAQATIVAHAADWLAER